jgi:hypothetical protein
MSFHRLAALTLLGVLTGCGTYVPSIQEMPGDTVAGQELVQAIIQNVTCEIQDAVNQIIREDKEDFRTGFIKHRRTDWLEMWGVQTTLNLTIVEKSAINPVVSWLPPSPATAVFNLDASATLSSEATRAEKVQSYYTVKELYDRGFCAKSSRPGGLYLMQSDLKLREWLRYNVMLEGTGELRFPRKQNEGPFKQEVLQHNVKFEVVSDGGLTPGWKLARVNINQSGTFLSASRTRTHDLIITLGPVDPDIKIPTGSTGARMLIVRRKNAPSTAAANSHLAAEIGLAVATSVKGAR